MSTINEALLEEMDKAITAAETWLGQKAKRMTLVTARGEPIHYQFGIGFEIAPEERELTPKLVTTAVETATKMVEEFITANCREHFSRVPPETSVDTDFDTKAKKYQGYMRGTMIGAAVGAGPAKISKYEEPRVPGFASL